MDFCIYVCIDIVRYSNRIDLDRLLYKNGIKVGFFSLHTISQRFIITISQI